MQNRQPTPGKEGRVKITPEDGRPAFYATITMADDPLEVGTPWAKQSVWPDNVAEKFGLSTSSLPADGFSFLGDYNLNWWRKRSLTPAKGAIIDLSTESVSTIVQAFAVSFGNYSDQADSPKYSDSVAIDESTGAIVLSGDVQTITNLSYDDYTKASVLAGKYVQCRNYNPLYVPPDAVPKRGYRDSSSYYVWMSAVNPMQVERGDWEYVKSENNDEYPQNAISNGIQYEYLRIPYSNAVGALKFAKFDYYGDGVYESDGSIIFEVPFCPDLLITIYGVFIRGVEFPSSYVHLEWGDYSVKIFYESLNASGVEQHVFILGH